MGWIIGLIAASIGYALSKGIKKVTGKVGAFYTTENWRGLAGQLGGDIPVPFTLKWIEIESGGNPCATGRALDKATGLTKEAGISQFYYPDDYTGLGISLNKIRAACDGGSRSISEVCTRPLTSDELVEQMSGTIKLINRCRGKASRELTAVGAKWDSHSSDYYKMVKMEHALPEAARRGLLEGTKLLGHPPSNWDEFYTTVKTKLNVPNWIPAGPGQFYSQSKIIECLDNANKAGSAVNYNV